MIRLLTLPALSILIAAACVDAPASDTGVGRTRRTDTADSAYVVPYRLAAPDDVVELPNELREVSGLTVLTNGHLGAVQDESGTLYALDPATGAIDGRETFDDRGDFESVEQAGDDIWVLESNGDLTRLRGYGSLVRVRRSGPPLTEAERFDTELAGRNDTEGLAYDAAHNRLLIACKENPGNGLGDVRAIYAFDLGTETLSPAPVFTLDRVRLDAADPFKPSALAIRPGTGEIYVLSSVRKALAVLSPAGTLLAVVELPEALYPQPEGLAFAADGTLYLSNEGPDGPATLLRFDPTDP